VWKLPHASFVRLPFTCIFDGAVRGVAAAPHAPKEIRTAEGRGSETCKQWFTSGSGGRYNFPSRRFLNFTALIQSPSFLPELLFP
jgi:hypothetical protein